VKGEHSYKTIYVLLEAYRVYEYYKCKKFNIVITLNSSSKTTTISLKKTHECAQMIAMAIIKGGEANNF